VPFVVDRLALEKVFRSVSASHSVGVSYSLTGTGRVGALWVAAVPRECL
jgi:hypothetical protein